ncbi:putative ribosomal protein S5 (apicoplast) [Besnoitia besnoiti]|uniref:Putative ribosomal protein S5 n=1 Tax=Besnoitia besnoiti TaxID=94643 RepID=A0A2A9M041_BESBE|nr:putative ribosomal protein S5 [Besnoitia besnoiti]PFH30594.1 putative ribosomal protein S5 [Besnoitia besnoiti]
MMFIKNTFFILNFNKSIKKTFQYNKDKIFNKLIKQLYIFLFYLYVLKDFIFYKYFFFKKKTYWILINIFLFLLNLNIIKLLQFHINNSSKLVFKIKKKLSLYYIYIIKILLVFNYNLFLLFFHKTNKYNKILQKIIEIKKISKTKQKGRIKRFKVLLLIGAKNAWIGIGISKDFYLQDAINKARFFAFKKIYFFYIILEKLFFYSNNINKIKCFILYKPNFYGIQVSFLVQVFLELLGYNPLIIKIFKRTTKYTLINFFIRILSDLIN